MLSKRYASYLMHMMNEISKSLLSLQNTSIVYELQHVSLENLPRLVYLILNKDNTSTDKLNQVHANESVKPYSVTKMVVLGRVMRFVLVLW